MLKKIAPVLPLRDIVVFPHMVAPLFVGRKPSVNALNHAMLKDKKILLVTQKNSEVDNPNNNDLYDIGTYAKILQLLKLPDGTIKVLVEGIERVKISNVDFSGDFLTGNYSFLKLNNSNNNNIKALVKIVIEQFESYQKINKKISAELTNNIKNFFDYNKLADVLIANLNINISQKQELLEMTLLEKRLEKVNEYLLAEIDAVQIEKKIKGRV